MPTPVAEALTPIVSQAKSMLMWATLAAIALIIGKTAISRHMSKKARERRKQERLEEKAKLLGMEQASRVETAKLVKNVRTEPLAKFRPPGEAPAGYEWRLVKKREE